MPYVFHNFLVLFCRCFRLKASWCINRKKNPKKTHNVPDGFKSSSSLKLSRWARRVIHPAAQFKKSHAGLSDNRSYTLPFPRYVHIIGPKIYSAVTSHWLAQQWGFFVVFFFPLRCLSKKSLHPLPPESHPAAARSMKLLAKIPKDAEAVIVLVGKLL